MGIEVIGVLLMTLLFYLDISDNIYKKSGYPKGSLINIYVRIDYLL